MIENGIKEYIAYCQTLVDAQLLLDDNNNLLVNGTIVLQELTPEAINELKDIFQASGLSEAQFIEYFDNFILQEINLFLNNKEE
ncbi:MAG: hypothetical protein WC346_05270 [Methanogenium sp.]|jgi:hypothetical protein